MKKHLQRLVKFCCLWIATFYCNKTLAQNWQPIPNHDTVYFTEPIGDLAVLWIDSARQINTDSIFYFQPSINLAEPVNISTSSGLGCVDTLGASFLGKFFIKQEDSIYLLKDIYGDTITLKPFRDIGQPWIYKTDTAQIEIRATITEKSLSTINNELDSVITIQLQAFQLNIPINHELNRQIRLSKFHGFIEIYNLHAIFEHLSNFRNRAFTINNFVQLDKSKYIIPEDVRMKYFETQYTTANMFVYKFNQQGMYNDTLNYYIMDSIIAGIKLNDSTFIKEYKYGYYSKLKGSLIIIEDVITDTLHFRLNSQVNYLSNHYPYWNDVKNNDNSIAPYRRTRFYYDTASKTPIIYKSIIGGLNYIYSPPCLQAYSWPYGFATDILITPLDSTYTLFENYGTWINEYEESYQRIYSKIGNQITGYNPLPALEFTLQGTHHEERNELYWKTSAEMNTDYFIIERSNIHHKFDEIGQQKAAGNANTLSTYSFIDSKVPSDVNTVLYRIKLVDIDQQVSYSNTISLTGSKAIKFSISPIPCKEDLQLHYQTNFDDKLEIMLIGVDGVQTKLPDITWSYGQTDARIVLPSSIVKGIYFLDVYSSQSNHHYRMKIIKE